MSKLPKTIDGRKVIRGEKCPWFFQEQIKTINEMLVSLGYDYKMKGFSKKDRESLVEFFNNDCLAKHSEHLNRFVSGLKDHMFNKYHLYGELAGSDGLAIDGENQMIYEIEVSEEDYSPYLSKKLKEIFS